MEENEQNKRSRPELHKEISSIFEGVPVPRVSDVQPNFAGQGLLVQDEPDAPLAVEAEQPAQKLPETAGLEEMKAAAVIVGGGASFWQKIKNKLFGSKEDVGSARLGEGPCRSTTRKKITVISIPVLFVVLIFVLFHGHKVPVSSVSNPIKPEPIKVATEPTSEINWEIPNPYPAALRDPMKGTTTGTIGPDTGKTGIGTMESGKAIKLNIKGIVHSGDNPAAMIGTQIVHEGDAVSGATVVKINQDSVEFEMNGKRWTQKIQ